jgi:predicted RNA-binding Zn ribbon-like protein
MTISDPPPPSPTFDLLGGRLCLDFANTVGGNRLRAPEERLRRYADLVSWAEQVAVVDREGAKALLERAERNPGEAERVLAEALALREALFRLYVVLAEGEPAQAEDLALLDAWRARAAAHQHLAASSDGAFALAWEPVGEQLEAPLWRVALSAAQLLTEPQERARVRLCGLSYEEGCGWVFLDETRNGRRRWCSMKDCGNRAKARRHYARQRAKPAGS